MPLPRIRLTVLVASLVLPAVVTATGWSAESSSPAAAKSPTTSTPRPAASRGGSTKGVLPDPALLDGSSQAPEKKSDYGMIGDFEMPGEENAKNGKVGGSQQGAGEQQQPPQQQGGGGNPPAGAAGTQGQPQQGGQAAGDQSSAQSQAGGGPQNENAKQGNSGGAGDPNAKAEGMQVAQIGGEGSDSQGPSSGGGKPPPVAIGDKAMRIQTTPNTPGVVGQQQVNINTQVYEKATGTGGKGPSAPSGANRTEKGRAIPSGL